MASLQHIIVRPLLTEKVSAGTDRDNTYGFLVHLKANKNQITNAVEKFYDVKVMDVRTMVNPGKMKRRKNKVFKTSKTKKALVRIASDQKIKLFEGV